MWARFVNWFTKYVTVKQVVILLAFCMLVTASFAFGAALGRRTMAPPRPVQSQQDRQLPRQPIGWEDVEPFGAERRGTFGAIDQIEGDVIRVRDPRSGRTWRVRTGDDTVIEFGRHRRIPFDNLRVGQRIFVVGVPDMLESQEEFDAQFIGVLLGQPQKFTRPVGEPILCRDCLD
jgi:hypothetical protein